MGAHRTASCQKGLIGIMFLCYLDDLPDGGARGFDPWEDGRDSVFIVRKGDSVYGYFDSCPHLEGMPLPWRKDAYLDAAGQEIVCAAHGARFNIVSGACFIGPCKGQSLTPVPLTVSEDGQVLVRLEELTITTGSAE